MRCPWGCGAARDEADDRLFDPAGLDELGTLDLSVAADECHAAREDAPADQGQRMKPLKS